MITYFSCVCGFLGHREGCEGHEQLGLIETARWGFGQRRYLLESRGGGESTLPGGCLSPYLSFFFFLNLDVAKLRSLWFLNDKALTKSLGLQITCLPWGTQVVWI